MNRLKRLLTAGHPQFGLFCVSNSLQTAEALAGSGFDFVVFDTEHSPQSLPHLHAQFTALAGTQTACVTRVPSLDLVAIKHCLDLGAHALLVPNVGTADQARDAVRFSRYPADGGVRGVGGTMRATRYGRDKAYFAQAAAQTCVMVQIESREGLANLDAICAVDGIDLVFFGPADLSADMGYMGQPTHPDVVLAIEDGIQRARVHGVAAGVMAGETECARYVEAGATLVILGSDLALLVRGADALAARFVQPRS